MNELPVLGINASGPDVRSVQGLLCARGHIVTIDGTYGPVTRSAVTAFQHSAGLSPDGMVGLRTWTKLLNR